MEIFRNCPYEINTDTREDDNKSFPSGKIKLIISGEKNYKLDKSKYRTHKLLLISSNIRNPTTQSIVGFIVKNPGLEMNLATSHVPTFVHNTLFH